MNWFFYVIWSIISFLLATWVVFSCGWEKEKVKYNWILEEDNIPVVYNDYSKRNTKHRRFLFILGGLSYTLSAFVLHFLCYGVQNISTFTEYITRSVAYFIILTGLISQTSAIDTEITNKDDDKKNEIANVIQKTIMSIRRFFFERIIKREKKVYNKFVSEQIHIISNDSDLKNLFMLKCQSESWSKTLGISVEEYKENIANRLWDAFVQDVRFNEVTEEIFNNEFDKFNAKVIDIIRLFDNCTSEQVKNKEKQNQKKIDELIHMRNNLISAYGKNISGRLTVIDVNEYEESVCNNNVSSK